MTTKVARKEEATTSSSSSRPSLFDGLSSQQQRMLADFSKSGFDEHKYIEKVMRSGTNAAAQVLEDLAVIIQSISSAIHKHVGSHHGQLLRQAEHIRSVNTQLNQIRDRVRTLHSSFNNAKTQLYQPYNKLRVRVKQLEFLQSSNHLSAQTLRVVAKIQTLKAHIRSMEANMSGRDIVKAARLIRDIMQVMNETDLSGIVVIEEQKPFLEEATEKVGSLATKRFQKAVKQLNQTEIASTLQAFLFLGCLQNEVDKALHEVQRKAVSRVREALDVSRIGEAKSDKDIHSSGLEKRKNSPSNTESSPGRNKGKSITGQLRSALWKRLDVALQNIFDAGVSIYNLQQVLLKKKDMATYQSFLSVYLNDGDRERNDPKNDESAVNTQLAERQRTLLLMKMLHKPSLVSQFYRNVTEGVKKQLDVSYQASSFVRTVVVSEFPRLQHVFRSLLKRLKLATFPGSRVDLQRPQQLLPSAKQDQRKKATFWQNHELGLSTKRNKTDNYEVPEDAKGERKKDENDEQKFSEVERKIRVSWETDAARKHDQEKILKQLLGKYEIAYLKSIISKLNHPIKTMFASAGSGRFPSEPDAELFLNQMQNSLRGVKVSAPELQTQVANRVKQAINLLVASAEEHVDLKTSAKPIPRRNHHLYRCLAVVDGGLHALLRDCETTTESRTLKSLVARSIADTNAILLPEKAQMLLKQAKEATKALRVGLLDVLVGKAKQQILSLMMEIHTETFQRPQGSKTASKYMRRVQRWSETFARDTMSRYRIANPSPDVALEISQAFLEVSICVAKMFMLNASLISGLREDAKLAIASDIGQLEAVLHHLAPKEQYTTTPGCYTEIRQFKQTLFIDEKTMVEKAAGWQLNPVVVAQVLMSRMSNRSVPITCVPYKALRMSLGKYNRWLEQNENESILKRFKDLLEEIRKKIDVGRMSEASLEKANASLRLVETFIDASMKVVRAPEGEVVS